LQGAHDRVAIGGHHQALVGIGGNGLEGVDIGGGRRRRTAFAPAPSASSASRLTMASRSARVAVRKVMLSMMAPVNRQHDCTATGPSGPAR
jgi:hypothetical protein